MNASINALNPEELAKLFESNDDFSNREEAFRLLYEKILHFELVGRQRSTPEGFLMHPINCHRLDVVKNKFGEVGVICSRSRKGRPCWLFKGDYQYVEGMVILLSRRNKPPVIVKVPVGLQDFLRKQAGEPYAYHEIAL